MLSPCSHFNLQEQLKEADDSTHMALLREYAILDSEPEQSYDDITELVATVTSCPVIALVFFDVEKNRVWFKSSKGLDKKEMPLTEGSFERFGDKEIIENCDVSSYPSSLQALNFKYWGKTPVCCPQGYKLGELAFLDYVPRKLTEDQIQSVLRLSRQTWKLIELRRTINLLNAANKHKSSFMGMVSHDIRQPLGNIMLSCELLSEMLVNPSKETTSLIQTMHSSAGLMHNLVDDMLQMVKVDLGKLEVPVEKRPVNLGRLLANVVDAHSRVAAKKNIKIDFSIINWNGQGTVTPWEIVETNATFYVFFEADPLRLEQVINNLLSNAIKFSYPGSKVELLGEKKTDGIIEITVRDYGQGIPASEMPHLFSPFSTLSVKPTAGEASNGLGLCIVKSIIEAHQGNIIVESRVGEGTSFKVTLPGKIMIAPVRRNSAEVSPKPEKVSQNKRKLRILFADDNTINQYLVSQVLSKRGHDVLVAVDGAEALQIFETEGSHDAFDLLLIDEEMPRMKGTEVIEKIRMKEKQDQHIPIISISGHVTNEFYEQIRNVGADHLVSKPFNIQKLISTVEQYTN